MSVVSKLGAFFAVLMTASPAIAIPGQSTDEAAAWMQSNSTLRPQRGEKLLVRRSHTAAQRFSFEASILPPGKITRIPVGARMIRSETMTFFDMQNGVTLNRLRESLRSIYGIDIAQDFDRASVVVSYPDDANIQKAVTQQDGITAALQGELRKGDQFGYWLEIAQTTQGFAYTGRLTIFLKEDTEKLQAELGNR
jgi:hypothetical protein